MVSETDITGYRYEDAGHNASHNYLLPALFRILDSLSPREKRLFELGCGNGSVAQAMTERGWKVTGVDPSREGIEQARKARPHLNLYQRSAYDDLAGQYGQFPVVVSLEVVEHVYAPRDYARTLYNLLERGG